MPMLIPAGFLAGAGAGAGAGAATAGAVTAGAATAGAAAAGGLSVSSVLGGVALASGITSAIGSVLQGNYQKKAANAQAQELHQQSDLERTAAGQEVAVQDTKAMHTIAAIGANAGASGVTTEGSPGDVSRTSIQEQSISDMYVRQTGQLASMRDIYKATLAKSQGAEQQGAGFINAGGGLLTTGIKSYGIYSGNFGQPYLGSY